MGLHGGVLDHRFMFKLEVFASDPRGARALKATYGRNCVEQR